MSFVRHGAHIFEAIPTDAESETYYDIVERTGRHYSIDTVSKRDNIFEAKLIAAEIPIPLTPDELGGTTGNDEFIDIWNDEF